MLTNDDVTRLLPTMIVPCEPGFVPVQMEVKKASSERGKIPARICLLGNDLHTYKVFALPEDLSKGAVENEGQTM